MMEAIIDRLLDAVFIKTWEVEEARGINKVDTEVHSRWLRGSLQRSTIIVYSRAHIICCANFFEPRILIGRLG